ncbi:hypothetical protein C4588_01285 [Candidatus Parcubacteria bacterium]|nr:MAG: hypothetical protein C4588_01285 [Candidatus Parcubacteria bacterium]
MAIKKSIIITILVILMFLPLTAKAQNSDTIEDELTGIWHCRPFLGSGWNDRYCFFSDGTFTYAYNQMDGEKRIIDKEGTWIIKDNMLFLVIKEKTIITGGEFIKATGSIATDYEIINGKVEKIKLDSPEEVIYPITTIETDTENPHLLMIKIGGIKFWKLSDDPYYE